MLFGSLDTPASRSPTPGVSAAHALQFAIGAATGTPHGLGTGLMLPYVMAFNRPAREPALAELAAAFGDARRRRRGARSRAGSAHRLACAARRPRAARGAARGDGRAGGRASVGSPATTRVRSTPADCTAILRAAWHGDPSLLGGAGRRPDGRRTSGRRGSSSRARPVRSRTALSRCSRMRASAAGGDPARMPSSTCRCSSASADGVCQAGPQLCDA